MIYQHLQFNNQGIITIWHLNQLGKDFIKELSDIVYEFFDKEAHINIFIDNQTLTVEYQHFTELTADFIDDNLIFLIEQLYNFYITNNKHVIN